MAGALEKTPATQIEVDRPKIDFLEILPNTVFHVKFPAHFLLLVYINCKFVSYIYSRSEGLSRASSGTTCRGEKIHPIHAITMQYALASFAFGAFALANPVALPQAVTAAISPSEAPPPGCTPTFSGSFSILVKNLTTSGPAKRAEPTPQVATYAHVSMITDGQVQGGFHTAEYMAMQKGDGQIQVQTTTVMQVTQYSDGQPQAPTMTFMTPTSTAPAVTKATNSQAQATSSSAAAPPTSTSTKAPTIVATSTSSSVSSSTTGSVQMVACEKPGQLAITLNNGVLKDAQGRTGYIASNFQFQFDSPPQAKAIYTSGFSSCSNGTLALGGSNIFYQCRSGDFFNLYNTNWAAQCSPVTISIVTLKQCAA